VAFSGFIMSIFILLQTFYPLVPFYAMGCLLATCTIHTFIYQDKIEERAMELGTMRRIAYIDALTGVKNKMAYNEAVAELENHVLEGKLTEYGVAVFDLNNLKYVNDTMGHEMGDKFIKDACSQICRWFQHSPVYRIGGDEFVVLLKGDDYDNREMIFKGFNEAVHYNKLHEKAVVAGGCATYLPKIDRGYDEVFRRADKLMYQRKQELKWT
jgi:diguanylate cyclase (GGDEF)-like protein